MVGFYGLSYIVGEKNKIKLDLANELRLYVLGVLENLMCCKESMLYVFMMNVRYHYVTYISLVKMFVISLIVSLYIFGQSSLVFKSIVH